jgi:hypothetical protein
MLVSNKKYSIIASLGLEGGCYVWDYGYCRYKSRRKARFN